MSHKSNWHPGPLPAGTFNFGGIVTHDMISKDGKSMGFKFADFHGDHVMANGERVEPNEVAFYNNSLEVPPSAEG